MRAPIASDPHTFFCRPSLTLCLHSRVCALSADVIVWKVDGDKLVVDTGASSGPAEWIDGSAGVTFTSGQGLPGRAWAAGGSVEFAPNVQSLPAEKYPRLELAKKCGIKGSAAVLKDGVVLECGCATELTEAPAL